MWGPSPKTAGILQVEAIELNIDNDAATPISHFQGDLSTLHFLRYDVTSVGAQLRHGGGSAAIIGVGGGRDVLNCAANGIHRIVGIEVNSAIVEYDRARSIGFRDSARFPDSSCTMTKAAAT